MAVSDTAPYLWIANKCYSLWIHQDLSELIEGLWEYLCTPWGVFLLYCRVGSTTNLCWANGLFSVLEYEAESWWMSVPELWSVIWMGSDGGVGYWLEVLVWPPRRCNLASHGDCRFLGAESLPCSPGTDRHCIWKLLLFWLNCYFYNDHMNSNIVFSIADLAFWDWNKKNDTKHDSHDQTTQSLPD